MQINISSLESYCKKNGMTITTNVDIGSTTPSLKFIKGKNKDGSRAEYLNYQDLYNILQINNVLEDHGLLVQERNALENDLKNGLGNSDKKLKKMETLIYDTLSKYIIQMLKSEAGKLFFPSLIPLPNHKDIYFRENQLPAKQIVINQKS